MKTEFRSGEIQEIVGSSKRRIEYLMKEIPIEPDVERVEGTGRAHTYSYRNLLQFFIAEHMAAIGLGMREIRFVLSVLDKPSEILKVARSYRLEHSKQMPKDFRVAMTKWPLDRPKGLIAKAREYRVVVYEPDKVGSIFKDYYIPSPASRMYLILSVPTAPHGSYYLLGITGDLEMFAKYVTQPSFNIGRIHTFINLESLKGLVGFGVEFLESGDPELKQMLDGYTGRPFSWDE